MDLQALRSEVLLYAIGVPLYAPSVPTMMARCAPRQKRGLVMGADGLLQQSSASC